MDRKIKLLAVASMVAIMASGCSAYRGASQGVSGAGSGGYSTDGSGSSRLFGQRSRSSQVAGSGQVAGRGYGQQRSKNAAVCAPCGAAPKPQTNYTYKPAKPAAPKPQAQAGQHNQQYYIDQWNRQQAQQKNKQNTGNYTGYGAGTTASNTTYYDYSSAGGKSTAPAGNVSASNKSIYTGSYQQKTYKPYQPTTYAGGSAATTKTAAYANTAGTSGGGSTYMVKKGDTVFEIMRQTGVYWKDIISINNLTPPYNISPGQTIRLK